MRSPSDSFPDRAAAGRELAARVAQLELAEPVVLALPRGGVPVAAEIAMELDAPLDVLLVRKIGAPGHRELGLGAVGEEGVTVLDTTLVERLRADPREVERTASAERVELERRAVLYRGRRPPIEVRGRDVVIVDDGIATGGSAAAAVEVVRRRGARTVVVAVPVAAESGAGRLREVADDLVCPRTPSGGFAVGAWYDDFHQLDDDEVVDLLRKHGGGDRS